VAKFDRNVPVGSYATPESILFDKAGNALVGQVGGGTKDRSAGSGRKPENP
jgi:hypothetical protein